MHISSNNAQLFIQSTGYYTYSVLIFVLIVVVVVVVVVAAAAAG